MSPCISALHEALPEDELTLVAKPAVCELYGCDERIRYRVPFSPPWFPGFDGKHDGWERTIWLAWKLRRSGVDIALNTTGDVRSNLVAWLAGARRRIVCSARHDDWLATDIVAKNLRNVHEAERLLQLAEPLIGRPVAPRALSIRVCVQDRKGAMELLEQVQIAKGRLVGLHPGANVDFKEWSADGFVKVGRTIVSELGCRIVVLGGQGREQQLADRVAKGIGDGAVSLGGKTSVGTLLGVLERCRVYVGNDSGPMHLAAAVGCPVAAIFGANDPRRFGPYMDAARTRIVSQFGLNQLWSPTEPPTVDEARHLHKDALGKVDPSLVVDAVTQLWQSHEGSSSPGQGF